jgi:hypothetical protein
MAVNYTLQLGGSLQVLENPTQAGDRPAELLDQWKTHLGHEGLADVAEALTRFEQTFASGDEAAIRQGLLELGRLTRQKAEETDDHTVTDHLQQLSAALTKAGSGME